MNKKNVKLAGIAYETLVNGPGMRRVLFAQGCVHACENCFNESTHSFEGGEDTNMDDIIEDIINNPIIKGVTFSGGDPLEQADKFSYLAKRIKEVGLNIWCYTGYKFEYIISNRNKRDGWNELLQYVDIIVDGKFEEKNKIDGLRYRGSSNQRIIDVKESLRTNEIKLLDYDS